VIRKVLLALALAPAIAAAHGAPPAQSAPPPPNPTIYFRSPANNAVVGTTFPVVFGLKNYGVAPAGINVARTGHFHVFINAEPGAAGTVIPTDSLHRHFGGGQIETELTLAPGTYTLRLVLADFEHKVIGPELVSNPIKITVRAGRGGRE
jgi:hypothetical protein